MNLRLIIRKLIKEAYLKEDDSDDNDPFGLLKGMEYYDSGEFNKDNHNPYSYDGNLKYQNKDEKPTEKKVASTDVSGQAAVIDRLLDKINREGEKSLTPDERNYLKKYSSNSIDKDFHSSMAKRELFICSNKDIPKLTFELLDSKKLKDGSMKYSGRLVFDGMVFKGFLHSTAFSLADGSERHDFLLGIDLRLIKDSGDYDAGTDLLSVAEDYFGEEEDEASDSLFEGLHNPIIVFLRDEVLQQVKDIRQ